MGKFIFKRLLVAIPTFIVITFIVFTLVNLAPGGPLDILASSGNLKEADLKILEKELRLDKPVPVRYALWVKDLFSLELGTSTRTSRPVSLMITQRLKASLILTGSGILGAILLGIPLGIISAYKQDSIWDHISTFISYIGTVFPSFFLSLLLIYILGVKFQKIPISGMNSAGAENSLSDFLLHLVTPATLIGLQVIGNIIKQTKNSVLGVLNEDYIKTARSKGISEFLVLIKHAVRNALIPIVTIIGLNIPFLVGGAVVIEQIFAWPGIGSLMTISITQRDYPVIMGITVLIAIAVLVANIFLDILYVALDPRLSVDR